MSAIREEQGTTVDDGVGSLEARVTDLLLLVSIIAHHEMHRIIAKGDEIHRRHFRGVFRDRPNKFKIT